jgi:hypothetical protein
MVMSSASQMRENPSLVVAPMSRFTLYLAACMQLRTHLISCSVHAIAHIHQSHSHREAPQLVRRPATALSMSTEVPTEVCLGLDLGALPSCCALRVTVILVVVMQLL